MTQQLTIDDVEGAASTSAEERVAVATQLQLTWWRFKNHKLAYASGLIIAVFYLIAIFADFLAYSDPLERSRGPAYP